MSLEDLRRDVERPAWNSPLDREDERCICGQPSGMCRVHGYVWKRMYGLLRGDIRFAMKNPSHSWKLNEAGGFLKIYNIKRLR